MPKKTRRIAVMGYAGVGKSALCVQFVQGKFSPDYSPTIQNTYSKDIKVGNQEYKLELVDTAGQDEFSILSNQCTMDINAYIFVYSITALKSFDIVSVLYEKLVDMGKQGVPIILVGNKTDLQSDRMVPHEFAVKKAQEMNAVLFEATAKENELVTDIFMRVINEMEKTDSDSKCILS